MSPFARGPPLPSANRAIIQVILSFWEMPKASLVCQPPLTHKEASLHSTVYHRLFPDHSDIIHRFRIHLAVWLSLNGELSSPASFGANNVSWLIFWNKYTSKASFIVAIKEVFQKFHLRSSLLLTKHSIVWIYRIARKTESAKQKLCLRVTPHSHWE